VRVSSADPPFLPFARRFDPLVLNEDRAVDISFIFSHSWVKSRDF
jgi:hypothetical protein